MTREEINAYLHEIENTAFQGWRNSPSPIHKYFEDIQTLIVDLRGKLLEEADE